MAKIFHKEQTPETLFDAERYTKPSDNSGALLENQDAVVDSTTTPAIGEQQATDEPATEPVDANSLILSDDTDNDQSSNKNRNAVLAAAGSAGLAVLLYLSISSTSSDDATRNPEAVAAVDTSSPSVNDVPPTGEPNTDPPKVSETLPPAMDAAIPEGFIEPEPGFVVPETRTGFPENPPGIRETDDAEEVLAQLAELAAYIESTGDFSLLQYLTDNEVFIDRVKTNYNNKLIMEEQHLIYDYYYWRSYIPSRPHAADLDAEKGFETIEVNSAKVGFSDDQYSDEGQMFSSFERYDIALKPKQVSDKGREMTIWVIDSTGPASFEVFNDPHDMFTNDGV